MSEIKYNNCCANARPVMVDWEDRGLVFLLDLDRVACGKGEQEEIVYVKNCSGCPHAYTKDEEVVYTYELWRYSYRGKTQASNYAAHSLADSEK